MRQVKANTQHSTSRNLKADYKCNKCKDTTWIETENGMKRCTCYEKSISTRRWERFGVDPHKVKSIKNFQDYNEVTKKAKSLAIKYIQNFQTIRHEEENGLAFLGQPGAGKSHLAVGIGANFIKGVICPNVIYMPYLEAMKELKCAQFESDEYFRLLNKYTKADLLIIDDLFKDKVKNRKIRENAELTEADTRCILPIINQRYINNKPTIYSSECTPNMLLDIDEALAGRILERSNVVVFKYGLENNYRMRKFK